MSFFLGPDGRSDDRKNEVYLSAVIAAYARQMPILYVILCVSAVAVATSFWGVAPTALVLLIPGALVAICALRLLMWARRRNRPMGKDAARRALRTANVLGPVLAAAFLGWAFALFGYGDAYLRAHVIFFCGFTVVSCIFCQLHVRNAALGVTAVIVPASTVFLMTRGEPTLTAVGINLAVVCAAMVRLLFVHSESFKDMISWQVETDRLSEENLRLANADSLTGLPNRRRFFDMMQARFDEAGGGRFVMGLLDLDGFKPVNDLYGHSVGDQVLVEVGRRLQDLASPSISFARLGGDEFAIFADEDLSAEETMRFGTRICEALAAPVATPSALVTISASIGFVASCDGSGSVERLYERADYALYHAKHNGRGRAALFTRVHETAIRRLGLVEQALRSPALEDELSLVFQPIVDLSEGRSLSFEALARWTSAEIGVVSPADFIAVAERSDIITRITQTLLTRALAEAKRWPDDVCVSFNLSARDLSSDSILKIISIVGASGVAPGRIVFEITETAAMRDFELAQASLAALRALGARIALDDFGSGYSSLNSVRRLTLDKIKVDRGFTVDIEHDETARDIVKTVIDLCRNLKISCVVEGVETEGQSRILRSLGCTTMQGYLYSRPMPASEIAAYLDAEAGDQEPRRRSTVM